MQLHSLFGMFARYNAWSNERVYHAAASLPDEEYRADHGAFFGSVHGTLNHLLVADRIWMQRFTGVGSAPRALDSILYDELDALRRARKDEDARILTYVDTLTDEDLAGTIRYRTISKPAEVKQTLSAALPHFFNHQTHHRGQVHCLLTKITGDAPPLDLILYQRESGEGVA